MRHTIHNSIRLQSTKVKVTLRLFFLLIVIILFFIIREQCILSVPETDQNERHNTITIDKKNVDFHNKKKSDTFNIKNMSDNSIFLINIYVIPKNNNIIISQPSLILKPMQDENIKASLISRHEEFLKYNSSVRIIIKATNLSYPEPETYVNMSSVIINQ